MEDVTKFAVLSAITDAQKALALAAEAVVQDKNKAVVERWVRSAGRYGEQAQEEMKMAFQAGASS